MKCILLIISMLYPIIDGTSAQAKDPEPIRVLFIGNSQMYTCDLPQMVSELADSAPAGWPRLVTGKGLVGGCGLQGYWDAGETEGKPRAMVAAGPWDVVVLQEAYDIWNEPFADYAERFVTLIRAHGAKPLLFATASISDLFPDKFIVLNDTQAAWGSERDIHCASAGYAWMDYLGPQPTREALLDLYHADGKHPGPKGSYLYACLLYAHLTGKNPEGLTRSFAHLGGEIVTEAEAKRMQNTAWRQYQTDRARQ